MLNLYSEEIDLRTIGMNVYYLLRKNLKETLISQRQDLTYQSILLRSQMSEEYRRKYEREITRLIELGHFTPYPSQDAMSIDVESDYDKSLKLPFVIHNGKKLYFPHKYTVAQAVEAYRGYICGDRLLGKGEDFAPHQYQSKDYCVHDGDVVVDVGCAEALFSLDLIEQASKIYLIERNSIWKAPLQSTFAPFKDKVVFVQKLASDKDGRTTVSLPSLLRSETSSPLFIKMDIEGYESKVVRTLLPLLREKEGITMSCCTYHNNNDATTLEQLFQQIGYQYEFSKGYMLFARYDQPVAPYFRHGVIRASNRMFHS
ncbi:MAG: hypothetical protein IKX25_05360 [Bacteroidales bacterium]|nr:hypothetical protein [Bacteroidales bacterium]